MSEYENPNELPKEDPYTYYAGTPSTPSEYRYVPEPKTKKKKQPWLPAVGQELVFRIYRQGENLEITVYVGEQIQNAMEQQEKQSQQTYPGNFPWGRP
ncbi:MAG: hypothetical protein IKY17_02590 [Oscillospiraceae bacterium]|nr:hypothetical protein [Oscillospiraceae bacterium]